MQCAGASGCRAPAPPFRPHKLPPSRLGGLRRAGSARSASPRRSHGPPAAARCPGQLGSGAAGETTWRALCLGRLPVHASAGLAPGQQLLAGELAMSCLCTVSWCSPSGQSVDGQQTGTSLSRHANCGRGCRCLCGSRRSPLLCPPLPSAPNLFDDVERRRFSSDASSCDLCGLGQHGGRQSSTQHDGFELDGHERSRTATPRRHCLGTALLVAPGEGSQAARRQST